MALASVAFVIYCVVTYFVSRRERTEIAALKRTLNSNLNDVQRQKTELDQKRSALERERSDCAAARRTYEEKAARQDALAYQNAAALCSRSCLGPTFSEYQIFQDLGSKDALQNERLYAACFGEISLLPPISVSCSVRGEHGEVYKTTLKSCTCKDYQVRRHPCKHMYYLALRLGLLSTVNEAAVMDAIDDIHAALGQVASERKDLAADQRSLAREQQKLNERARQEASVQKNFLRSLDTYGYNPDWLAKLYADFHAQFDAELVEHLRERARPAKKTAARIEQEYLAQMRDLRRSAKAMEYRLYLYHLKFPEWDDIPPTPPEEPASDRDPLLRWLSEEEYRSLPSAEKSQLALDRWSKRKKSPWDIGVEFEQYVGYRYETDGYRVIYYGAVKHMDDLGRDLICTKSGHTVVVQCKRWASAEKCIHENVVFQLYATTVAYQLEHPDQAVTPLLVCTCALSDTAKQYADYLKVQYSEFYEYMDFPRIKCNINKSTGDRIYHLPFDQQYNHVAIIPGTGECYAQTVREAENKGFRRAYRHAVTV